MAAAASAAAAVHFSRLLLLKAPQSSPPSPTAGMWPRLPIRSPLSSPKSHSPLFLRPVLRRRTPYRLSVKEDGGGSPETLEEESATNSPVDSPASDEPAAEDAAVAATDAAASSVAEELKQMMDSRRKEEASSPGLLTGVAEEVGEIEWPAFDKVLGTTGIVLAVIVGSSVALLTINAVLAELSDKVFAGKGIQDFF